MRFQDGQTNELFKITALHLHTALWQLSPTTSPRTLSTHSLSSLLHCSSLGVGIAIGKTKSKEAIGFPLLKTFQLLPQAT